MRELFCTRTFRAHRQTRTGPRRLALARNSQARVKTNCRNKHALITHKHVDSRSGKVKSPTYLQLGHAPFFLLLLLLTHTNSSRLQHNNLAVHFHWQRKQGANFHVSSCARKKKKESQLPLDMRTAAAECKSSRRRARAASTTSQLSHQVRLLHLPAQVAAAPFARLHAGTRSQIQNIQELLSDACQDPQRSASCAESFSQLG